MSKLGEKLGFLFEVGFNIGLLTYIKQNNIKNSFGDLYSQDLQQLKFSKIIKKIADSEGVMNESDRKIIKKWVLFFLQKSFLSGLNLFQEYLEAIPVEKCNYKDLEILYYQCYFHGDNSLGTYNDKGETEGYKAVLSQLKDVEHIDEYKKTGQFLKADTLMLLKFKNQYHILCLDYSIFSIQEIYQLEDLHNVEVLKRILLKEISYLRKKSIFSNLGLDSKNPGIQLSKSLANHYTAFATKDKESIKMIQAGSYAYSFWEFLRSHNLLRDDISLTFNIIGYSDRGISSMTLTDTKENIEILETCHHIYKKKLKDQQISTARKKILDVIQLKAAKSFKEGKNFLYPMLTIADDGISFFVHQEKIENFSSPLSPISLEVAHQLNLDPNLDLRNAHQELIKRELESDKTYLFLTGNPGIGKTTAITEFLKQEKILNEGFLFIYVSPRIQVNLDIIEKFTNKTTNQICDDQIFTITTNSNLIKRNGGKITVNYCSNKYPNKQFTNQDVHFINQRSELDFEYSNSPRTLRTNEDTVTDVGQNNKGVLCSLSQAINTIISQEISNNIVATVAMQSYKKTKNGDTLLHLEKIFSSAYNSRIEKIIDAEMEKISRKIKHIFFMLDEITGDENGVHFLDRINKIFKKFNLINNSYGFNPKIIIADASIVNPEVINQHLSDISPEPNKIFFRKANSDTLPLSLQNFEFKNKPATIINTNSYPAKSLNITYKVFIQSIKFDEQIHFHKENKLKEKAQNQIIDDIQRLLKKYPDEQIIVYIQDKARLQDLINNIKEFQKFDYQQHYLEIHADLFDTDKKEIYQHLNKPTLKVIFMTASASRGLSFPKVKHILVEIPRFEVEKNLMEVIQVIYRGRGDNDIDRQDKQLIFYLAEQAVYDAEEDKETRQLAIQESVLSLINLLLILKTSIMTRIMGSGKIGKYDFMMIPIGGKSVSAAGETFSSKMSTLIKQLKKEHRKQSNYEQLEKVYTYLEKLLKDCELILNNLLKSQEKSGVSYLDLRGELSENFSRLIEKDFDNLLNYLPLEKSHISGSLLVVPVIGKTLEERYRIQPDKNSSNLTYEQLIKSLQDLRDDKTLPENIKLGIKDAIDFIKIIFDKADRTQNFEQDSQYEDQYYAIPLFAFISAEIMEQYFANNEEESAEYKFRDILNTYIRSLYPVTNILPIGNQYQEFPFIVFRSYSLNEIRSKLFTDKYFLNSHEINVLSLILSTTDN